MNYKQLIEDSFKEELNSDDDLTKLQYLARNIFEFTTYDSAMDELFATKALEVSQAINEGKTFEYIKDSENYRWYIQMCNMGFFNSRLDWGTSIRGAWWNYHIVLESCGLWQGDKQLLKLKFTQDEWKEFIKAIIEFAQ